MFHKIKYSIKKPFLKQENKKITLFSLRKRKLLQYHENIQHNLLIKYKNSLVNNIVIIRVKNKLKLFQKYDFCLDTQLLSKIYF